MSAIFLSLFLALPLQAQDTMTEDSRVSTGGAQTLADILARQKGEKIDDTFRKTATGDPDSAAGIVNQLGTLGGVSDPEVWRALRYGTAKVAASTGGEVGAVLVQDGGMKWLEFRQGPLLTYGGFSLLVTLALLALFYAIRGKIKIDGPKTGRKIERFKSIERFGHWLLAGSFIVLGLTGLLSLFGRMAIIPLLGRDSFSSLAVASKWVHNNVGWAFMLGLIMVFVMWVVHNIPDRNDLKWIAVGGGIFKKGVHPPAKKFNAGQKIIFWSVILLGASISVSGLSLLFPFQMPIFGHTFEILNTLGLPQLFGTGPLETHLAPQEEMQLAQSWHSIIAFLMIVIILAHIYIGSVGMEGAYDAMGSGQVEEQWAKEHHSLWVDELADSSADKTSEATPAE
jgi:formate dehydrogenase subunit gamma